MVEQQILRFQIAMDDGVRVKDGECGGDLSHDPNDLAPAVPRDGGPPGARM